MAAILQATVGLMGVLLLAVAGFALWLRPRIADGRIPDGMGSPYPAPAGESDAESSVTGAVEVEVGPWNGVPTWIEAEKAPVAAEVTVVGTVVAAEEIKTEPPQ